MKITTEKPFRSWSDLVQFLLLEGIHQVHLTYRRDIRDCRIEQGQINHLRGVNRFGVYYHLANGEVKDEITYDGWKLTKYLRTTLRDFLTTLSEQLYTIIVGGIDVRWDLLTHRVCINEVGWYIDHEEDFQFLFELDCTDRIKLAIRSIDQAYEITGEHNRIVIEFGESRWGVYLEKLGVDGFYPAMSMTAFLVVQSVWKEMYPHVVEKFPGVHVDRLSYQATIPTSLDKIVCKFRPWHVLDRTYEKELTKPDYEMLNDVLLSSTFVISRKGG